jgi:hypothetical protein
LIDKLLLEKISLAAIARIANISAKWLQNMSTFTILKILEKRRSPQKKGKIILQCDEVWSFLGNKENNHGFG